MSTRRWLSALILTVTGLAGPLWGQSAPRWASAGLASEPLASPAVSPEIIPSVRPMAEAPTSRSPLERVALRSIPGSDPSEPLPPGISPMPTATSPASPTTPAPLPGPWMTDRSGCCGPVGGDGPVTYELYLTTGINFVGGSDLTDRLNPGVIAGGGGRTLFYEPDATAAWVIDLGVTFTWNRGRQDDTFFAFDKGQTLIDPLFGTETVIPPTLRELRLRALYRTSFNYAIGRDWWLWGPGVPGMASGWNCRWGAMIGGRWGTAHVDLIPYNEPDGYQRNQATFLGLYGDVHLNWEVPLGGCLLFGGFAVQYGYDWMNIIPPLDSDINNVNIQMFGGVRF